MKKISVLILALMLFATQASADSFSNIYHKLKIEYPSIISRIYDGGATDSDMERFLSGMEKYINNKNVDITEDNIDDIITETLSKVIMYSENLPVYNALLSKFTDEALYFLKTNTIPPSLKPLFDAVKSELLSETNYISPENNTFKDIGEFLWAEEAINSLTQAGILAGYSDGTFLGNSNITRAEFTKIIVLANNAYDINAVCDFEDVDADSWYAPFIASAKATGIINGYENNTFRPDDLITRQDISVIVYNAMFADTEVHEPSFSDSASISDYARTPVGTMQHLSIIKGMGYNLFYPRQLATRAQAAQIIYNALNIF